MKCKCGSKGTMTLSIGKQDYDYCVPCLKAAYRESYHVGGNYNGL